VVEIESKEVWLSRSPGETASNKPYKDLKDG